MESRQAAYRQLEVLLEDPETLECSDRESLTFAPTSSYGLPWRRNPPLARSPRKVAFGSRMDSGFTGSSISPARPSTSEKTAWSTNIHASVSRTGIHATVTRSLPEHFLSAVCVQHKAQDALPLPHDQLGHGVSIPPLPEPKTERRRDLPAGWTDRALSSSSRRLTTGTRNPTSVGPSGISAACTYRVELTPRARWSQRRGARRSHAGRPSIDRDRGRRRKPRIVRAWKLFRPFGPGPRTVRSSTRSEAPRRRPGTGSS